MICHVAIEHNVEMDWSFAIGKARWAVLNNSDEKIIITNNKTGEVLFHYENHAIQWMNSDFAKELSL